MPASAAASRGDGGGLYQKPSAGANENRLRARNMALFAAAPFC